MSDDFIARAYRTYIEHPEPEPARTDLVNSPPHYKRGGIELIEVIEALELPYHLACVVKYVARAGHKDPSREVEDLEKARWYLERWIERLKEKGRAR